MGSQALAITSKQRSQRSEAPNRSDLIRLWIGKLSVNAGQALTPTALGVFESIWQEGFEDLDYAVLEAAFKKTLRECSYWPVKVADVRSRIDRAKEVATSGVAEQAWQRVLELRRRFWNPDVAGGFSRGMPELSPRIDRAARAAGVFRDHESVEALHVWAKKKFIECFTRWDEAGESENLLPDGEIKNLLTDFAQAKALPAPAIDFHSLRERGLRYAEQNKLLDTYSEASRDLPCWEPEKRAEVEAELQNYGERFKAAMEKRQNA